MQKGIWMGRTALTDALRLRLRWLMLGIPLLPGCHGKRRNYDLSALAASPAVNVAGKDAAPSSAVALNGAPKGRDAGPESQPSSSQQNGANCSEPSNCLSGNCEVGAAGSKLCCARACSALHLGCSADGSDCAGCEEGSTSCSDGISRSCNNGQVTEQTCGNGCDAAGESCNPPRPTGALCDAAPQCESGLCALDVSSTLRCCDPGCEISGRVCGGDGTCVCPAGREDVAGVCQLQLGQSCSQAEDCATGFCTGTLAGGTVCCAQSCVGAFCTADGSRCVQCDGSGASCDGTNSARCEDGALIQTPCNNGCNTATGVCNGLLPSGQACTTSGQCATNLCSPDLNGTQRCCTPNCAATGRACGVDGSCVCPNASDIFNGSGCGCPANTKSCGDGRCIANGQCCETCLGGSVCQAGNCTCPGNQQLVNGQCRLNLGVACSATGTPCASGSCVDGVCCESSCDGVCMQCRKRSRPS
jgi:hypothetical protein